ncbi:MAG: CHASE domain-containing protein [Gammaproteobacteria bacterium]|nr:CHASE domain-containing protein [Gammaproteobacteria bacterium]
MQLPSISSATLEKSARDNVWALTGLVFVSAMLVTFVLWMNATRNLSIDEQERFTFQSEEIHALIEARMATYEQVLRGVQGLFAASEEVSRQEFAEYFNALSLAQHYPGMLGVAYSKRVPAADLQTHLTAVRAEGFPNYDIRPAGLRDVYTSIIYIEPFGGVNLNAFGFDMYSEPVRRAAMDRAAATGAAALSAKVALVQDVERLGVAGVLLYLPVYGNGQVNRVSERTLLGWVYAPFSMDILMQGVRLDSLDGLEVSIYDGRTMTAEALLYSSADSEERARRAVYESIGHLSIAGQPWTARVRSTAIFEEENARNTPTLVVVSGIILSLLLTILVWTLVTGRERALVKAAQMTRELRYTEFRWKAALAGAGDGVWDWHNQTGEVIYSSRWKAMLNYRDDEIGNTMSEWERLIHPDDRAFTMATAQNCVDGLISTIHMEMRMRTGDGQWRWILTRGAVVSRDEQGKALRTIGTHTDISAQKAIELALLESDRRFRGAFETAPIGMALVSLDGHWLQVNKALVKMFGYTEADLMHLRFHEITHTDDLSLDVELLEKLRHGEIDHYNMEKRYYRKDGTIIYTLLSVSMVTDQDDRPVHYVSQIEDISERKQLQELVLHQATHDELTGLPNRRLLYDRLAQTITQCRRYERLMALMFVDIDYFKGVNDSHGHDVGDEVLCEVANRLRRCVRVSDTLARQGGDEFVVLLSEIHSALDVERVVQAMLDAMHVPLVLRNIELQVTLSIGISIFDPKSTDNHETLLKKADDALYKVKNRGRNAFQISD